MTGVWVLEEGADEFSASELEGTERPECTWSRLESKAVRRGAIFAHYTLWPLVSPGNPQEGEYTQQSLPFPREAKGPPPPLTLSPYSFSDWSPPVPHITFTRTLPLPPFRLRSLPNTCPSAHHFLNYPPCGDLQPHLLIPSHALTLPGPEHRG